MWNKTAGSVLTLGIEAVRHDGFPEEWHHALVYLQMKQVGTMKSCVETEQASNSCKTKESDMPLTSFFPLCSIFLWK